MVRLATGSFLIAHGLVHLLYLMPRPEDDPTYPFVPESRWSMRLLGVEPANAKTIAAILGIAVALTLLVSGILLFADAAMWRVVAVAGTLGSAFLLLIFFHPWLTIGVAIDGAILLDLWVIQAPASLFE